MMNISLGPNDIGMIKLDQMIDLPNVVPTVFKNPSDVQVGQPVSCLGYGAPNFFELHMTPRTQVIKSTNLKDNSVPDDIFFIHDSLSAEIQTTPDTPLQAIETGDEGCPMVDTENRQLGLGMATWRISDNSTVITFASIGIKSELFVPFVMTVLASDTPNITNSTPTDPPTDAPVAVQSFATSTFAPSLVLLLFTNLFFAINI